MNSGIWRAAGAYAIWGMFPAYWKWLQHVPALQLIGHRIIWSCLILVGVILFSRRSRDFRIIALTPAIIPIYIAAALLIGINWLVYVWAVNTGFIVEASLGYFINPLLSILLGVIFLRERLRPWQWVPIGLSALGVLYLTFTYGRLPWIALTLAFSFGLYGLVKKTAPLGSLFGLLLETGILFLPALLYLVYANNMGQGAFLHTGAVSDLLMFGGGLITTVPLLMFASAVQRIPLFLVGILQYITPTLQFLLGVLVYREPFTGTQLIGFGLVWVALIIFGIESFFAHRGQIAEAV
ncbi:MAG TPA: EamA family transporter RarD [Desulfatirhabdiaceae bacterium]|nr:EamA family transporter RarD [Desulfatirhabdiaceae bacterium]